MTLIISLLLEILTIYYHISRLNIVEFIIKLFSCIQHVDSPSWVTDHSSTLIDHIATSSHTSVEEVLHTCTLSNYIVQIVTLQLKLFLGCTIFVHLEIVTGTDFAML